MKKIVVPFAVLAILATAVMATADTEEQKVADDTLDGKVVIINPSSIARPRTNARIATLGNKNFIAYEVRPDSGNPYESWIAIDDVSYLRVFENMQDANAYLERQRNR